MSQDMRRLRMDQPGRYRIQVQGCIDKGRSDWFNGLEIVLDGGDEIPPVSTLTGTTADQAALMGLLQKVYVLGLPLLLVRREEREEAK